jgi:uncharacterized protein YecE (DUF72 family)
MSPSTRSRHEIHVGCSGWNYRSWNGSFYPEGEPARRWLSLYAERFGTVEVNATFYRLPNRDAVRRWAEQTPPEFVFAVKASRYLTHVKRLADPGQGIKRFYERIEPLPQAGRLGPVLWQLPESFHRDEDRLAAALAALPKGRHAFEFRHPSWFVDEVYTVLSDHNAALVIGDHPERPFQIEVATASFWYVRLHYGRGRRGNYSQRNLDQWARKLRRWRKDGEVFVYFNNDWETFAPRNAQSLIERL